MFSRLFRRRAVAPAAEPAPSAPDRAAQDRQDDLYERARPELLERAASNPALAMLVLEIERGRRRREQNPES